MPHGTDTGRRLAAWLLALPLLSTLTLSAQERRQATGKFEGRNWTFETWGAYAYPGEVGFDDLPGIRVAISNASFDSERFDLYWDREHAIETYHRDDETLVATLQFGKDGKYLGMSYSFGSGDGCGFCFDGATSSTVAIRDGRLSGKVKLAGKPDEVSFEIELDVPIAPEGYGEPLPADGGEPGAAYRAYHEAIAAWDPVKTKPFFTDRVQARYAEGGADRGAEILEVFRRDHPDVSMKILRGFRRGDLALLLVTGEVSFSKVDTEVHLRKEGGTWRIVDEMLQIHQGE